MPTNLFSTVNCEKNGKEKKYEGFGLVETPANPRPDL